MTNGSGIIYDVMKIDLQKFASVIFGKTRKPLYITPLNLVRSYITNKEVFVNLFHNLKSDWSLVPGPFCF